jgi:dTDP-4-amino-4,6-dideoxygalactose transaminase
VTTERIYPSLIPAQTLYASGSRSTLPCVVGPIPTARDFTSRLLCLPMHEFLQDEEVERVIAAIRSAFA